MRFRVCISIACLCAGVFAADGDNDKDLHIRMTGYSLLDAGYINETQDLTAATWRSEPFGGITAGLRLTATPTERLYFILNPELKSSYIVPQKTGNPDGEDKQKARWEVYVEETKFTWTFGNPEQPPYRLTLGYMQYKENPDGRIFGDYLFRSMIYPSLLYTKFNSPRAQIFGLHFDHRPGAAFRQNLFLLSETRYYPLFDISLAYAASYSLGNMLEVGAGVNLRSVIPVRPSRTTPTGGEGAGLFDNTYKQVGFQQNTLVHRIGGDTVRVSIVAVPGTDLVDVLIDTNGVNISSTRVKSNGTGFEGLSDGPLANAGFAGITRNEQGGGSGELYPELGGSNTKYSFAGQLGTVRASFNPLGFKEINPLGKDALKVYAEAAVLGWKNYPGFYEERMDRVPIMFGMHMPTFNFLDFLAVEAEYFPNPEFPTYEFRYKKNVPHPGLWKPGTDFWKGDRARVDDWKWGVAAKKSFNGYAFVAQAGTDHTKMIDIGGTSYTDILSRPAHWYFQLRFIGGIY